MAAAGDATVATGGRLYDGSHGKTREGKTAVTAVSLSGVPGMTRLMLDFAAHL